jgi:peptidoglycan/xylan/chitin deacetylase (PgdA/CDA1 family)
MLNRLWSFRREAVSGFLYWSGIAGAFDTAMRPQGAIILMYHSVAPEDVAPYIDPRNRLRPTMFDRQMSFLSKYRRVVPLGRVIDQIASGRTPSEGTVCVTFDDGYLDNLNVAAPVLEKYKLPATLFLATGYVERSAPQWADVLYWLFQGRTRHRLRLWPQQNEKVDLSSEAASRNVQKQIHRRLLEATHEERDHLLLEMKSQLLPQRSPPRLTMNWDDARKLLRRYPFFEIGGHTRNHIDLLTHCGDVARAEVVGCADDIRRELGIDPQHFSFPYGRWCGETRDLVHDLGWRSAIGAGKNVRINAASDRFAIPRVDTTRTMTQLRFKSSGAYPGVLSLMGWH